MCSGGSRVSSSLLYLYYRTTYFVSGVCPMCLNIFSTTYSLSLTVPSLSFFLQVVVMLCWYALLCDWSGCRGVEDGACATRSTDTVFRLPLWSTITVLFWTLVIRYDPLVRAWSLLYVSYDMTSAEASVITRKVGLSSTTYDLCVKEGISWMRKSYSSLYLNPEFCILTSTLPRKATIRFCKSFCIDCKAFASTASNGHLSHFASCQSWR